jgi:hypothetical protein
VAGFLFGGGSMGCGGICNRGGWFDVVENKR